MFLRKKTIIKALAALVWATAAQGMSDEQPHYSESHWPECRETDNGFQVFDQKTGTWGAEIRGYWPQFNCSGTAALVTSGENALCKLVKTSNGVDLTNPFGSGIYSLKFSPSGNLVCFFDDRTNQTIIINVEKEHSFIVPGGSLEFSFDDDFVVAAHERNGLQYYSIFKAANGECVASIPGRFTLISPRSLVMAVGSDYGPDVSRPHNLADPILIDLKTGKQIGPKKLKGSGRLFTADGKFFIVQQSTKGAYLPKNPMSAFYSTENGIVRGRIPGWADIFFTSTLNDVDWETEFATCGRFYQSACVACDPELFKS